MKKIFSVSVLILLLLFLVSCGNDSLDDNRETDLTESNTADVTDAAESSVVISTDTTTEYSETGVTTDVPDDNSLQAVIDDAKSDLTNNGWADVTVLEGEPDSANLWGGLIIDQYPLADGEKLYSVIGNANRISAVLRIVEKDEVAKRAEVYYVGESGIAMRGIYLESFLGTAPDPYELLSADNESLYNYFWGSH